MKNIEFELNPALSCTKLDSNNYLLGTTIFRQFELEKNELVEKVVIEFSSPKTVDIAISNLSDGPFSANEYREVIEQLIELEIITKSFNNQKIEYKKYNERYDRQIRLFSTLTGQNGAKCDEKLKNSRVALIGVGGTGSYILYTLAAMGVGYVKCVDFDKVESSNLSRQILYTEQDIGKEKLDCAKRRITELDSSLEYDYESCFVDSVEKFENIIQDVDFCILSIDTPRHNVRHLCNTACIHLNIPFIYGGSLMDSINVGPLVIPKETGCIECLLGPENKVESHKTDDKLVNSFNKEFVSTLIDPYNALAASYVALEVTKYLSGFAEPELKNKVLMHSLSNYDSNIIEFDKSESCACCGS